MPRKQSFEIGEFYAAYQHWIDIGAPDDGPFFRGYGLCRALDVFCQLMPKDTRSEMHDRLAMEMKTQFVNADLDIIYPFSSQTTYHHEVFFDKCYLNQVRRQWVKERANG